MVLCTGINLFFFFYWTIKTSKFESAIKNDLGVEAREIYINNFQNSEFSPTYPKAEDGELLLFIYGDEGAV
jgi:hypothetical protein